MKYFFRFLFILAASLGQVARADAPIFTLMTLSGVGSQSDSAARFIAPLLSKELKQPVIVSNHPGGNGTIGLKKYQETAVDCQSLLIGHSVVAYNSKFNTLLSFDPMKELTPLYGLSNTNMMVLVSATLPIYNMDDLVKHYEKAGRLLGSSTIPNTVISMAMLDASIKVKTTVVNYKVAAQAGMDLAAGLIDYTLSAAGNPAYQAMIDSQKIRPIAVTGFKRSDYYKTTPTLTEQGYNDIEAFAWNAFFVHASASDECKTRLKAVVEKVMNSPEAEAYGERAGHPQRFLVRGTEIQKILQREYIVMFKPAE